MQEKINEIENMHASYLFLVEAPYVKAAAS